MNIDLSDDDWRLILQAMIFSAHNLKGYRAQVRLLEVADLICKEYGWSLERIVVTFAEISKHPMEPVS